LNTDCIIYMNARVKPPSPSLMSKENFVKSSQHSFTEFPIHTIAGRVFTSSFQFDGLPIIRPVLAFSMVSMPVTCDTASNLISGFSTAVSMTRRTFRYSSERM
jgi:hypothetical protein